MNTSLDKMLLMINIIWQNLFHTFVYKSYLMNVRWYPGLWRVILYPGATGVKWRKEKWTLTGFLGRVYSNYVMERCLLNLMFQVKKWDFCMMYFIRIPRLTGASELFVATE